MMRTQPNIIVTGTPGVGKTTHCETLAQNTGLKHLNINDIVKERGCHDGFDEEFGSWIVDEDKVSSCDNFLGVVKRKLDMFGWGCFDGARLTFVVAVARLHRG
jgi:broad-specificity NMP kinase